MIDQSFYSYRFLKRYSCIPEIDQHGQSVQESYQTPAPVEKERKGGDDSRCLLL